MSYLESEQVNMGKVCIHFCGYHDLLSIPSVGQTTADRIWDLRKQGDITPENLVTIPCIRMDIIHEYIVYTALISVIINLWTMFRTIWRTIWRISMTSVLFFSGEDQDDFDEEVEDTQHPDLQTIIQEKLKVMSTEIAQRKLEEKHTAKCTAAPPQFIQQNSMFPVVSSPVPARNSPHPVSNCPTTPWRRLRRVGRAITEFGG
ncbi:unnamed protein product [Mytilus coruscus]|uniref:Uncharacterized protein n=1 Tax=Mytilus coruscus TaxID=42192 RepID=A0A6J8ASY2_MYTCO|nr:unnamed protein product [Mytilus coruscus]